MKDKLLKMLKAKEEARAALVAKSDKSEDVAEVRSIQTQINALNVEMGELRTMIQVWNRFHKAKCQNGNDANVERKAVGKAFREIRREL